MLRNRCILIVFAALAVLNLHGAESCTPMTSRQRSNLETYIRKAHKLPEAAKLTIAESTAAPGSCFRRIEVKSDQPKRISLTLYASPDLRFLTPQLLDTRVDPAEEERRRAEAFRAGLNTADSPSLGPANAPVTITVFSDFQCPFCAGLARTLREEILPKERDSVRLVFRFFPLEFHGWARAAAKAEVCANEQSPELFWKLHDYLFENQRSFTPDNLIQKVTDQAVRDRRFNKARFSFCIADARTTAKIDRDVAFGNTNGVHGTPTIFVNGQKADVGNVPEQIRSLIREASAPQTATR